MPRATDETVTVHTEERRHRVSPLQAAIVLVDAYGWAALNQEVVGTRTAAMETWRQVRAVLAERADAADLQAELIRILNRGGGEHGPSSEEMIELIQEWAGDAHLYACRLDSR